MDTSRTTFSEMRCYALFPIVIFNVAGVVRFLGFCLTAIVLCGRITTERRGHREEVEIEDERGTAEHAKHAERKTELEFS